MFLYSLREVKAKFLISTFYRDPEPPGEQNSSRGANKEVEGRGKDVVGEVGVRKREKDWKVNGKRINCKGKV